MAVAVTGTGVRNSADSATGWSTGSAVTEGQIEGSGYIGAKTGSGITRYNHLTTPTLDFTPGSGSEEGEHVVVWYNVLTTANLDSDANGGIRAYVGNTASTNYEELTISNVGYFGGWQAAVFNPQIAPGAGDFSNGTYNDAAADAFGITYNMTSGIMGNFVNAGVDQITIGFGVQVTGATQDFQDILDAEATNVWGWVIEFESVIYPQGKIEIGDGTTTTSFTDTGKTIVFRDQPVASDFYEFLVDTDATCTLGAISSGVTSGGVTITSAGTALYALTITSGGSVEAIFNAYASTFNNFRVANLNASTTMQETTFNGGGQIATNGATLTDCNVLNSTETGASGALVVTSVAEMDELDGVFFSGNDRALEITTPGTYDFNSIDFAGNTFDVLFSSATGDLIINIVGGTAITIGDVDNDSSGSVTINNNVTVTITVQDAATDPIEDAVVAVYQTSNDAELANGLTDVSGEVSLSVGASVAFYARIRKSTFGSTRYFPIETIGNSGATGVSLTITLIDNGILNG